MLCAGRARHREAEQQEQQSHDTTHSQGGHPVFPLTYLIIMVRYSDHRMHRLSAGFFVCSVMLFIAVIVSERH